MIRSYMKKRGCVPYIPDPPLLQERETPVFRNLESVKIRQDSQNDVFVRVKQSDHFKSERDGTTRNQG